MFRLIRSSTSSSASTAAAASLASPFNPLARSAIVSTSRRFLTTSTQPRLHTMVTSGSQFTSSSSSSSSSSGKKPSDWQYIKKHYLSDSATYPIMGIIAGAVSLLTFAGIRQLTQNPDVKWDKLHRESTIPDEEEWMPAPKHYAHKLRKYAEDDHATRVSHVFTKITPVGHAAADSKTPSQK